MRLQYGGFPDILQTIEDMVAEGNKVLVRVKITGTHTGNYQGIAPTVKKFVMVAVPTYRQVECKIGEGWSVWDSLGLFKVLGVIKYNGFPDESSENLARNLSQIK